MAKNNHLTKEQELALGRYVQDMLKAKEELASNNKLVASVNAEDMERVAELKRIIYLGDQAVARIVQAYTGLVRKQAQSFKSKYPSSPDLEDLIQEGMGGLITGIHHYDPSRNNKISTVVTYWIFQAITRWTNKTGRLVKLPENRVTDYTRINRMRGELELEGFTNIEADELIMKKLNLSKESMQYITNAASIPVSLNKMVQTDGSSPRELIEVLTEDQVSESSEVTAMKNAVYSVLRECLDDLTDIQKDIISASYSLDSLSDNVMTAKEVREKHNISPNKYKRLHNDALTVIKSKLSELGIDHTDFIGV